MNAITISELTSTNDFQEISILEQKQLLGGGLFGGGNNENRSDNSVNVENHNTIDARVTAAVNQVAGDYIFQLPDGTQFPPMAPAAPTA